MPFHTCRCTASGWKATRDEWSGNNLSWEGGCVQAQDPVRGSYDGHIAADALQMPVQIWELCCHKLLHSTCST